MTLMVNGKKVMGYALGGTEFYSIDESADGSINIGGQNYLNENKMKITDTSTFDLGRHQDAGTATIDVTSNLSNYGGCLAILEIFIAGGGPVVVARPISIPTTATTESLSFYDSHWSGSLSKDTDNEFTLDVSCNYPGYDYDVPGASGDFYILSNDAS